MTFTDRINERRKTFKNIGDVDEVRRRREVETVQIRKKEKDEQLAQRRKLIELSSDIPGTTVCFGSVPICACMYFVVIFCEFLASIPKLAASLMSTDPMTIAEASIAIRKILSVDRTPPIDQVLKVPGILDRMRELLTDFRHPNTQLEVCWALTNIASGTREQTSAVVDSGVVPFIVKLLESDNEDLQEQAVWAIANIAGDRVEYRDGCIAAGTLGALCMIIEKSMVTPSKLQLLRLSVWGLSNMFRGEGVGKNLIAPTLPILSKVVVQSNDTEVLADAAWALSYLTVDDAAVIDVIPLSRLMTLLAHPSSAVHVPTLRVVGNLLSGDSAVAQKIMAENVLFHLKNLLGSHKKSIRKESLWAISNICADSQGNLQRVINSTGLMQMVMEVARTGSMDIRVEAIWSVCNACMIGSRSQLEQLENEFEIIQCLCIFLESARDTKSLKTVLDSIFKLLCSVESSEDLLQSFTDTIEECGGMIQIENLQHDESEEVYESCVKILERFFSVEAEQENYAPSKATRLLVPRDSDVARSG